MRRLGLLGVGCDVAHFTKIPQLKPEAQIQPPEAWEVHAAQDFIQTLFSKQLKEAWPETRVKILEVARELRHRADRWETYQWEEKPEYRHIVTPESKRNRAALLERAVGLMDEYLHTHPDAANTCIEVHSYEPGSGDFLMERVPHVPPASALNAYSRGGYLQYAGSDDPRRNPLDQPAPGDCIVVAGAPEGGGGALKLISPCWGQEEQAFMQIPALFIAIYGEGFKTRFKVPGSGNLMEITPVLVTNVVPLATLASDVHSTRKPTEKKDGDGHVLPPNYSTSVFHGSAEQFSAEASLLKKEGPVVNALFYSFTDMRTRVRDNDLVYRLEDLRDMATSVGKAAKLHARATAPKHRVQAIGVGAGIYEHAECVSAAITLLMMVLLGLDARLYYGKSAFEAAMALVGKVLDAMALKSPPAGGFTHDDYVREMLTQIGNVEEKDKVHWQIGGFKRPRPARENAAKQTASSEGSTASPLSSGASRPIGDELKTVIPV